MNITLLYFTDCRHWRTADERLAELATHEADPTISHVVIDDDAAAASAGFRGSPRPDD